MKQRAFTYTSAFESARHIGALLVPDDLKFVGELPEDGPQLPFLLHLSCMALFTPHIPYIAQRVMERIGLECPILGGPEACCGTLHNHFGDVGLEQQAAKVGLAGFRRARPTTVLSICPDCDESFAKHAPSRSAFKVANISALFVTHLDRLRAVMRPINRRVVLHTHHANEMRQADMDNMRTLLEAIPGLEVIQARRAAGPGIHCNILGPMLPDDQAAMFEEGIQLGADTIVVPYHSCYRQHIVMQLKYPVDVHHYLSLLALAMDIPFDEPAKDLRLLDDMELALDKLQPKIDALGLKRDDVRPLMQWGVYNWPSPSRVSGREGKQ